MLKLAEECASNEKYVHGQISTEKFRQHWQQK